VASALAKRLHGLHTRARENKHQNMRRVAIGGVSAALGWAEGNGKLPTAIMNVPTKLALAGVLAITELNTRGATQRFAAAGTDALIAIYGWNAGRTKSFIAGDGDDETAGDDDEM